VSLLLQVVRAQYEPPPVDSNDDSSSPPDPDAADNSTSSAISSAAGAPRRGKLLQLLDPDTIPDAPDWARPCPDWVKRFVTDFQQLRQQVGERYETGGESGPCFKGLSETSATCMQVQVPAAVCHPHGC
jgi:hypothetical protein